MVTGPSVGADRSPSEGAPEGRLVGQRYRLGEVVGRGAHTAVFRATDEQGHEAVALKYFQGPALDDAEVARRLLRKLDSVTKFAHRSLPRVRDLGQDEAGIYLVTNLVEGNTLRQALVQQERLEPSRVVQVGLQLLDLLHEAQGAGLVHGDLKPDNLVLSVDAEGRERLVVLDMGVARAIASSIEGSSELPDSSLPYASPERIADDHWQADVRSDLYSVGAILYEALCGQLPIPIPPEEDPQERRRAVLQIVPPDLRDVLNRLPSPLCRAVMKALAKDPADRYVDARAFREALQAAVVSFSPSGEVGTVAAVRRSRMALQLAAAEVEAGHNLPRADLTVSYRRRRLAAQVLMWCALLGVAGWVGFQLLTQEKPVDPAAERLRERAMIPPGRDLLLAELLDPIDPDNLRASIDALGDDLEPALFELMATGRTRELQLESYELWRTEELHRIPGARLKLLQALVDAGHRGDDSRVLSYLLSDLEEHAESNAALIGALSWADGRARDVLIRSLGRPGDGAGERGRALAGELGRDTPDGQVLEAYIRTGQAPPAIMARLLALRGAEWANEAGRELLAEAVRRDPRCMDEVLARGDEALRLAAVERLSEVQEPSAVAALTRCLEDRSLKVRLRAVLGLSSSGSAEALWPLYRVALDEQAEAAFRDEARHALRRIAPAAAVAKVTPRLAASRPEEERLVAIRALGLIQSGPCVQPLIEALRDPSARVRLSALRTLLTLQRTGELNHSLTTGLGAYREVARVDAEPQVRAAAVELYRALTGMDPQ